MTSWLERKIAPRQRQDMRRQREQFAVACDEAGVLKREENAPRGGARQAGGPAISLSVIGAGRAPNACSSAQAPIEAFDEIGGAGFAVGCASASAWKSLAAPLIVLAILNKCSIDEQSARLRFHRKPY